MLSVLCFIWIQLIASEPQILEPKDIACTGSRIYRSHNNADIIFYEGFYYLAYRTAPTHFPSRKAELRIVRSSDLAVWICDTSICLGRDIREPRWLVWRDSLYLYFFTGAAQSWRFDSEGITGMVLKAPGHWEPFSTGWAGWVPWRARALDSVAYFSVYWGKNLYGPGHKAQVRLLRSTDARHWEPITDAPQLTLPHATETDFWVEPDGQVWAIARAEGRGSYLCHATRIDSSWHAIAIPYKYDSPLLFRAPDGLYLVARRHPHGRADRAPRFLPAFLRRYFNLLTYSLSRKRTALYRIDTHDRRVSHVQDLPGWGDTAFPAIYPAAGTDFILINYTSPLNGKDRWWIGGQLRDTYLYWLRLHWHPAPPK